ncbi:putative membrane protein [Encephalitozoon hellem]|uniref:GPI-anchored wall transfer protein n=1 Tax=Encephalitozoon hellem TaxID=27973 RepID=A0ABY8CLV7_ENCHE|nr:putative membrane protein [Encephalitozoon hellem]
MKGALSEVELFAITSIAQLSVLIYHLVVPRYAFLEFLFSIVPLYLTIVFPDRLCLIYASFFALFVVSFLSTIIRRWIRGKSTAVWPRSAIDNSSLSMKHPTSTPQNNGIYASVAIDRVRVLIMSCVAITIFASDFSFYKGGKLGKSMSYGLKLMDIGVGSFVYNAGFFSSKATPQRKVENVLSSFFFGILRYLSKVLLKLDVNDAEFGIHLNFFLILGVLNLASLFINTWADFSIGFGMCLLHEVFLKFFGLEKLIYTTKRSNIITANIEGIAFILPQMGMFLMASEISKVVFKKKNMGIIVLYNLFFVSILLGASTYSTSCRRIHNLYFCMVIMLLHTTQGIVFGMFNMAFNIRDLKMHRFISKYLLFILIWSNLLVGINKLLVNPSAMPNYLGHGLNIAYLAVVFYLPYIALDRGIMKSCKQINSKFFSLKSGG